MPTPVRRSQVIESKSLPGQMNVLFQSDEIIPEMASDTLKKTMYGTIIGAFLNCSFHL